MAPNILPASSPVNIGDIVDKYRVERVIGVGAMGLVVSARHLTLDQVVAIKFLVEHRFGSREESIARFVGEARAAARIESDHVCRVSDVGMLPDGTAYMIMEHLEGNDLEEELLHRGQLDVVEAVDYVLQALDAIAAAHQLGIVHRDLKPANLFLVRRPDGSRRVKVLDFGISKATDARRSRRFITREVRSLGTPAYMPPEQIREPLTVDHRADIWALGCILYELLTGQMAFVGENIQEVFDRVLTEAPCPIPALRRDVPPELIASVARAISRDRDSRFQAASLFARSLALFGSVGVLSGLASIQREVGSLSSISVVPVQHPVHHPSSSLNLLAHGGHASTPSLEPMVANVNVNVSAPRDREMITQPDPDEVSRRRHAVTGDWAALQTRRRNAQTAVLAMMSALLFAGAIAILAQYVVPEQTASQASQLPPAATLADPFPPLPAPLPPPAAAVPIANKAPTPVASGAPITSATPPVTSVTGTTSKSMHSAPNSVRSTRNATVPPPPRAPASQHH